MLREVHDRLFAADFDNLEERKAIEAAGGDDPGGIFGFIEVKIAEGSPLAWAAETLRAIAAELDEES